MRAIILAAGRGERMRPLTDLIPKPLLKARGKPLIEWHIEALARAGIRDIVINCAWLEEQFPATLGDGSRWGVQLHYSFEQRDHGGALETAGGIATALPWLCAEGDEVFWAISGDLFIPEFDFATPTAAAFAASQDLAHLWLVPTSAEHPQGDFGIDAQGRALGGNGHFERHVFASFGLYKRALFAGVTPGQHKKMRPLYEAGIAARRISAELYRGAWANIGTPDQLQALG